MVRTVSVVIFADVGLGMHTFCGRLALVGSGE